MKNVFENNLKNNPDNKKTSENNSNEPKFDLIKLDKTDKQIDKIIEITHQELSGTYIDIDFKYFERHFVDNGKKKVHIEWIKSKDKDELKAFTDNFIINAKIILPKGLGQNQFIEQHFSSKHFKLSPRSWGSISESVTYKTINNEINKKHPLVILLKKIKEI